MVAKNKTISIREDQEVWIRENALSLSRFVQMRLDEVMYLDMVPSVDNARVC